MLERILSKIVSFKNWIFDKLLGDEAETGAERRGNRGDGGVLSRRAEGRGQAEGRGRAGEAARAGADGRAGEADENVREADNIRGTEDEWGTEVAPVKEPYTPRTLQDFIGVLRRTPLEILDEKGRTRIAAVMSFDEKIVADLMVDKSKMVFVKTQDLLGPLMLDKLYKSGFTNFPVVDSKKQVKGILHTEALNALEVRKTDKAEKYMDKTVSYLHMTDPLEFAVKEIERTNVYYFLVLDASEELAGFFTAKMLLDYLLG